jgi:hypothetical protein
MEPQTTKTPEKKRKKEPETTPEDKKKRLSREEQRERASRARVLSLVTEGTEEEREQAGNAWIRSMLDLIRERRVAAERMGVADWADPLEAELWALFEQ